MSTTVQAISGRHRWVTSAFLLLSIAMILIDTTVVNVALPTLERELGASESQLQWIVATFTLTFALLQVLAGRLGDVYGHRRLVLIGVAGFVAASAICAFAPSVGVLLMGRILQGAAGALVITQSLSIFQLSFPPGERATIFSLFGAVSGVSAAIGPPLGGVLLAADLGGLTWRPIFLINLPIGLITLIGAWIYVHESRAARPMGGLDLVGALALTVALLALLFPLIQGDSLGWPWWIVALMIASLPLGWLFWRNQRATEAAGGSPLVPPALFRQRAFVIGLTVCLVFFGAAFSLYFVFTLYLQQGLDYSALKAGLTTMAAPLATMVGAAVSSSLVSRFGVYVLTVGTAIAAVGQLMLLGTASVGAAGPWQHAPGLVLAGLGVGLVVGPVVDIVLERVPLRDAGSASGVLNTADQLGVAMGIALAGSIFFARSGALAESGADQAAALAGGLQGALTVNVGLLLGSSVLTLWLPRERRWTNTSAADASDPGSEQQSSTAY